MKPVTPHLHRRYLAGIVALLLASFGLFAAAGGARASQADAPQQQTGGGVMLAGSVQIKPVYEAITHSQRTPIDLVIVLDASSSMSWNWQGYGTLSQESYARGLWQYQPPGARGVGLPILCASPEVLALAVGCQSSDAYANYQERRIYKAKQLAKGLLDQFSWLPIDRAAVVTYSGGTMGAPPADPLATLTQVYPASGLSGNIAGGPGSLSDLLINQAASKSPGSTTPQELYTTIGASPGALGLRRAHQVLLAAPGSERRERVVLYLSDGQLDVNLAGVRSASGTIEANIGHDKPIFQAVDEATAIKIDLNRPAKVFVVAYAPDYTRTYLDEMASSPAEPYFQTAGLSDVLPNLLTNIGEQILDASCEPYEQAWQVPDFNRVVDANGTPASSIGEVRVTDERGALVATAAVAADGSWRIPNLKANTPYVLSFAGLRYIGDDNVARSYDLIYYLGNSNFTGNTGVIAWSLPIFIPALNPGSTFALNDPILLVVNGELCPVEGPTATATPVSTIATTATRGPKPTATPRPTRTPKPTSPPKPTSTPRA
ncbi:MAG: VWA domain-containing protein [Chloroflexales bacterium]|nr:VWA domain-containing protein [Chloroflexales bacterium]